MVQKDLREQLLSAWIDINGFFKDSRMTKALTYNEAIVMKLAFDQYRSDGIGQISVQTILKQTRMLKSLANRTINSLCEQGYLAKERNQDDARELSVRLIPERLNDFLAVHEQSLHLAQAVIDAIGVADTEEFVRICRKFMDADITMP